MSDTRETLRLTGDILAAALDIEPLGSTIDAIMGPYADDIEAGYRHA